MGEQLQMEEYALATIWEEMADQFGSQDALAHGNTHHSWQQFDERAARLASTLESAGIRHNSKVALYLHNCPEYLEGTFAALKIGAAPVNVNYRYKEDELSYLLDNSDAQALIYGAEFADRVAAIADQIKGLKVLIEVGEQTPAANSRTIAYADALSAAPQARREHSPDDLILLYTGGTTGMPKGVMHRTGTLSLLFRASLAGGAVPETLSEIINGAELRATKAAQVRTIVPPPLMHGTGWWSAMMAHTKGGCAITLPNHHFDPHEVWQTIQQERATTLVIVGDVFARPLLKALEEAAAKEAPYDISCLREINSSGAMWSASIKQGLLKYADMALADSMGASEGGLAMQITRRGEATQTAKFQIQATTKVFTEDDREVAPGSGEIGMLGTSRNIPLGYYKDPEKTARTFREIDGVRYSFPGDYATVEADGTITLLGRGSNCINTGGEKVYPEEVEEAVKTHAAVADCLVVGVPDEQFGERITAVVSLEPDDSATPEALADHVRTQLAGYKVPREFLITNEVQRGPNGKADYKWAKQIATATP